MPFWDRFDICEAYYVFAALWHLGGDTTDRIMHRLLRLKFQPNASLICGGSTNHFGLEENGYAILVRLVARHPDAEGCRNLEDDAER